MQLVFAVVTGSVAMWACYALGITVGPFVSSWAMHGDAGHTLGSLVGLTCGGIVGGWVAGRLAKPKWRGSARLAILIAPGSWLLIAWTLMTWQYLSLFWREAAILVMTAAISSWAAKAGLQSVLKTAAQQADAADEVRVG